MPLRTKCPSGHVLIVPESRAGKELRCPRCNEPFSVPAIEKKPRPPEPVTAQSSAPQSPAPPAPPPVPVAPPARKEKRLAPERAVAAPPPVPSQTLPPRATAPPPPPAPAIAAPPPPAAVEQPTLQRTDEIPAPPPVSTAQEPTAPPAPAEVAAASPSTAPVESPAEIRPSEPPPAAAHEPPPPAPAPPPLLQAPPVTADPSASLPPPPPEISPEPPPLRQHGIVHGFSQVLLVYQLAAAFLLAALFAVSPAMWDVVDYLRFPDGAFVARWALVVLVLSVIQLGYGVYLIQLPDWSTVWVVTLYSLAMAALYAMVLGLTLISSHDGVFVRALQLSDKIEGGRAALWCLCMASLFTLLAFFAGRMSVRWRRTEQLLTRAGLAPGARPW